MNSQKPSITPSISAGMPSAGNGLDNPSFVTNSGESAGLIPSFWRDRLIEAGMVLSMAFYYLVGNPNLQFGLFPRLNPLLSLPFLLIFALLCWYRLPFAVALLPFSLPYYYLQKVVVSHYAFSLVEITLGTCLVIALLRLLFKPEDRRYLLSWQELRERLGPFLVPLLVFCLAALLSITIAYAKATALRAFREEVLDPLIYVGLIFMYLRTRRDLLRLLAAFLGTGCVIALLGLIQYFFFRATLVVEADGLQRVHAVYGSANNIGLLFDYVLPLAMALLVGRVSWKGRLLALCVMVPMLFVISLTHSRGSWMVALPVAAVFVLACALRNRRIVIGGGLACLVVLVLVAGLFHTRIWNYVVDGHVGSDGHSTALMRPFLWLSALDMIHDSPWLGYGMDNWLCHYSKNDVCPSNLRQYWIKEWHGVPTGLADEPTLSHPHNVFLHIWVSMGIFGLLAFIALLILFYWLFARILHHLALSEIKDREQLRWMVVGVGAALLAAMAQGQIDSAFLEQDLSFCFWLLIGSLLLLRLFSGTSWGGKELPGASGREGSASAGTIAV